MHASCRDHGRPDNETPVHLAYRTRQEWVDLGYLATGHGDKHDAQVTVRPACLTLQPSVSGSMHVSLRFWGDDTSLSLHTGTVVEQDEMIGGLGFWPTEYRHMHGEIVFR